MIFDVTYGYIIYQKGQSIVIGLPKLGRKLTDDELAEIQAFVIRKLEEVEE